MFMPRQCHSLVQDAVVKSSIYGESGLISFNSTSMMIYNSRMLNHS